MLRQPAFLRPGRIDGLPVLYPPETHGLTALIVAQERHGDARFAPEDFSLSESELLGVYEGIWDVPPPAGLLERGRLALANPTQTVPAGARLQIVRVLVRTEGDDATPYYVARVLDGTHRGQLVSLHTLSNQGSYGYKTSGGDGPNPFMLREVTPAGATTGPAAAKM